MSKTLVGVDVFVRHTDKDGKRFVQAHRAWDPERFMKSLAKAAAEAGGKARVERLTEDQYRRALGSRRGR